MDDHENGGRFALHVELDGAYATQTAQNRALASLLLAIHGWLDTQDADGIDVTIDGRRVTLRGRARATAS